MDDLRERLEAAIASIDSALQDARIVFGDNPGACSARNTNALADLDVLREALAHPERLMGEPVAWTYEDTNTSHRKCTGPVATVHKEKLASGWKETPLFAPKVKP